jgi:predicted kinase
MRSHQLSVFFKKARNPIWSEHRYCNNDLINRAYQQLVIKETKEVYNKLRLVYDEMFDIIRYTVLMLLNISYKI